MNAFEAAGKDGRTAALRQELDTLFASQNQATDGNTVIAATYLRVTVKVQ